MITGGTAISPQQPSGEPMKATRVRGEATKKSDQQSFEPQYHQIKKMGFKPSKSKITVGEWNYQENQIYLQFMIENINDFLTEKSRRKTKVFFRLSKILKKRTPDQCRSHHQKLQLKYKDDLYSIIGEVHKKIQKSIAQQFVDYQHRLHYQPPQIKDLKRTAVEQQQPQQQKIIEGGWYQINNKGNRFIIQLKEAQIAIWPSDQ